MPDAGEVADAVADASTWDARVGLVRKVPEEFGIAHHAEVYSAIAERAYVPTLRADFAYVHWRDDYELPSVVEPYEVAYEATGGFADVTRDDLVAVLKEHPTALRVFRLLLGFTWNEFAEATSEVAAEHDVAPLTSGRVRSAEDGRPLTEAQAETCAVVIDLAMTGEYPAPVAPGPLRSKLDKPDTVAGWESVRHFAENGVPFAMFLHQRSYGGAFRQLLDATSSLRGDLLEEPVEALFTEAGVPYVRTGSHNQAEVAERFGLTVRPAPDFVVFDNRNDQLRAIMECKGTNDGGTARDKAARFRSLRQEAMRLGGVPLIAILGGTGWRRTPDALGPVVNYTDGRVFTLSTLPELLSMEPFPGLLGLA